MESPLTRNPQHQFNVALNYELSPALGDRIKEDISWMLANKSAIGVNAFDLYHAHICLPRSKEFSLEGIPFDNSQIGGIVGALKGFRETDPELMTTELASSPRFKLYSELLGKLRDVITGDLKNLILLYHSFEKGNLSNHPYFCNRSVITFPDSFRHIALPVAPGYTVSSSQIEGVAEIPLQLNFRNIHGRSDQDMSRLEIVASPHLLKV